MTSMSAHMLTTTLRCAVHPSVDNLSGPELSTLLRTTCQVLRLPQRLDARW